MLAPTSDHRNGTATTTESEYICMLHYLTDPWELLPVFLPTLPPLG